MRRLFSNFAHGPPAVGLLLMRLAAGVKLVVQGVTVLLAAPPLGSALFGISWMGLGLLLLVGLWTPLAGALVAVGALWNVLASGHPWRWIMLGTLGAALALLGPGTWSVDARFFGWKRLEIRDRKSEGSPPF